MVYFSQHFFSDSKKKTLDYSLWFFPKFNIDEMMTSPKLCKKDIIQKPFLKGAEWRLFQRHSIFQRGVKRVRSMPHANVQAR